MLAEESTYGEAEARDNPYFGITSSSSAWKWYNPPAPEVDPLTVRHNGKSSAAFPDGHVEKVRPEIGQMKEHYDPME